MRAAVGSLSELLILMAGSRLSPVGAGVSALQCCGESCSWFSVRVIDFNDWFFISVID